MTLTGLTEFLMARIAEDEAAASAVTDIGADVWDVQVIHRPLDLDPMVTHSTDNERTTLAQRFDPARVLAECDAMRLIVAIHSAYEPGGDPVYSPDRLEATGALAVGTSARKSGSPSTSTTAPSCACSRCPSRATRTSATSGIRD
jgi:Family of unknown function (DUF6221)